MIVETNGGKPSLKQTSVAKFLELKKDYDLWDIWRIRNPTKNYILLGQTIPLELVDYNPGHNILALFNNLAQVWIATSKTILDI